MKKLAGTIGTCLLASVLFAGCSAAKAETNTIELEKNGKITEYIVEDFSEDYYDEEELEAYLEEEVESYTSENGSSSVKLSGFKVEDGTASATIKYEDAADYASFKNVDFFLGTIVEAETEGYSFDEVEFLSVEDGAAGDAADTDAVLENDQNSVVILQEALTVVVPGEICYVSSEGAEVAAEDTAVIRADEETGSVPVVYIVYE